MHISTDHDPVSSGDATSGAATPNATPWTSLSSLDDARAGYQPFPNINWRNGLHSRLEVPLLLAALPFPHGAQVLEVGCGRGMALPVWAQKRAPRRLVGLDLEADFLSEASARCVQLGVEVELHTGDVRAMPMQDDSFDVVVDFGTCYHIERPDDALREIARVLVDGGLFIHETRLSQLLCHPFRTRGRALPWSAAPELEPAKSAALWASRRRRARPARQSSPRTR